MPSIKVTPDILKSLNKVPSSSQNTGFCRYCNLHWNICRNYILMHYKVIDVKRKGDDGSIRSILPLSLFWQDMKVNGFANRNVIFRQKPAPVGHINSAGVRL